MNSYHSEQVLSINVRPPLVSLTFAHVCIRDMPLFLSRVLCLSLLSQISLFGSLQRGFPNLNIAPYSRSSPANLLHTTRPSPVTKPKFGIV